MVIKAIYNNIIHLYMFYDFVLQSMKTLKFPKIKNVYVTQLIRICLPTKKRSETLFSAAHATQNGNVFLDLPIDYFNNSNKLTFRNVN